MSLEAPPPPYAPAEPRFTSKLQARFQALPLSIIHRILTAYCDPAFGEEEFTRRLWEMHQHVRLVNRRLYRVAMSILRSHYLPIYSSNTKSPNSSDPFPPTSHTPYNSSSVFETIHRETAVFDRFIALRLGTSLRHLESELCEEVGDGEEDLFSRLQPAARLEDLLLTNLSSRAISLDPNPARSGTTRTGISLPLPFSFLTVAITSLKASVVIQRHATGGAKRREVVVEVRRERRETLEQTLGSIQATML